MSSTPRRLRLWVRQNSMSGKNGSARRARGRRGRRQRCAPPCVGPAARGPVRGSTGSSDRRGPRPRSPPPVARRQVEHHGAATEGTRLANRHLDRRPRHLPLRGLRRGEARRRGMLGQRVAGAHHRELDRQVARRLTQGVAYDRARSRRHAEAGETGIEDRQEQAAGIRGTVHARPSRGQESLNTHVDAFPGIAASATLRARRSIPSLTLAEYPR
jgi:hypothetical protein